MTRSPAARKRWGFTMIEVLTVLMVMSVMVRIGVPSYRGVALKAEAVQIAADIHVVRAAVNEFQSDHNRWPADYGPGLVPPELAPYLDGLSFNRGRYRLDWQHWALPKGLPGRTDVRAILAVSVVTTDRALGAALEEMMGSAVKHLTLGDTYTFILDTE